MVPNPPQWDLREFIPHYDRWVDQENPDDLLRQRVLVWIVSRLADPYRGVRREAGFDNLWVGVIPDSYHGDHQVVTCSYFVYERQRRVVCTGFATLRTPV